MLSDIISAGLLVLGSLLLLIGALGLLRFPDVYSRMHAIGVSETLGAGLILVGLMFQSTSPIVFFKLLFIFLFLWLTSPTAGHTLVKAAQHGGLRPMAEERDGSNE